MQQFFKPDRRMQLHRGAGDAYLALEGRARRFRTIGLPDQSLSDGAARNQLEAIAAERAKTNAASPLTPNWAFERARKNIEAGQTLHAVDRHEKPEAKRDARELNSCPSSSLSSNEEKLRALLAEQGEAETLDYWRMRDLSRDADLVELAKDMGAMGTPTGDCTPEQAKLFDEATLSSRSREL